jgi:hypothetical protein
MMEYVRIKRFKSVTATAKEAAGTTAEHGYVNYRLFIYFIPNLTKIKNNFFVPTHY